MSPEWGIGRNMAYLETLNLLPVPPSSWEVSEWAEMQIELAELSARRFNPTIWREHDEERFSTLVMEFNKATFDLLRLRPIECWLVQDFVELNLELNKGKIAGDVLSRPTKPELELYFITLRDCLDRFLSAGRGLRHKIEAIQDQESAFFSVSLQRASVAVKPMVLAADQDGARSLLTLRERLRHKHSQWVYFDRSLKIYDRGVLYQFKPMQQLHWTRRQAVLDSDEIIAEPVSEGGTS
jgi:hypothetical protein